MQVFLVPVGPDRYELYCEEQDELPAPEEAPEGIVRRTVHRFRVTVAEAERERHRETPADAARPPFARRVKSRLLRYVAEAIAEQRLLWHLRGRTAALLVHPDDLEPAHAQDLLRQQLHRDFERHRFWLAVDSLGLIASAVLALLPGPNLVAYYFVFRIVGHFLSVRGARQGLVACNWELQPSAALASLRALAGLPQSDRAARVREVAAELGLEQFAPFFEKTAF